MKAFMSYNNLAINNANFNLEGKLATLWFDNLLLGTGKEFVEKVMEDVAEKEQWSSDTFKEMKKVQISSETLLPSISFMDESIIEDDYFKVAADVLKDKYAENFIQKILSGATPEKINGRMSEIRESLCAVNMVSFAEAMAYQELGEHEAARRSLTYYAGFIGDTYTSVPGLVQRLDLIDPAPENYWSKTLPDISEKIKAFPSVPDTKLLETKRRQRKKK